MNLRDTLAYGARVFDKSGPPIQLTFFITSRCNLRCAHCFYWKELDSDHSHELTIAEIEKIARSLPRLLVLSLTGGEPFVRKDIAEIHGAFARHARAHIVTISTNGFYRERMKTLIPKMLGDYPDTNLLVYVSIDGPRDVHNAIRGRNTYEQAMDALRMMQEFRGAYRNFGISASMTFQRGNEDCLPDTFQELMASGLVDNVNIGFVRGDPKDPDAAAVSFEKYKKLTRLKTEAITRGDMKFSALLMNRLVAMKDYYTYRTVEEVVAHDRAVLPCQAGALMGILYDDGTIRPCEILDDSVIGNIRDFDYDLTRLWASPRAEGLRTQIGDGCHCTFECAMSSSILFNPKYLAKIAVRTVTSLSASGLRTARPTGSR